MKTSLKCLALFAALAFVLLGGSGCSTTESENVSARPWNNPPSWQNGLPGYFNQGR